METKIFEYGKSFIQTLNNKDNTPRFLVESKCVIDGDEYYLAARCKGENTFAEEGLFQENSFEFFPLFGKEETLIFRRFKYFLEEDIIDYKSRHLNKQVWGDRIFLIKEKEGELLDTNKKIIKATQEGRPLMGRIVIKNIVIDFPIKTININENQWQVDTGPIPFPDYNRYPIGKISSFSLSFVCFNSFKFVEFLVEEPVELFGVRPKKFIPYDGSIIKINSPGIYLYAL